VDNTPDSLEPTIRPNRSVWVLPLGQVVDVEKEGATDDGSAFSHGLYVRKWIGFRLDKFCPDKTEREIARRMRVRASELLKEQPDLESEPDEEGFPNPFSGDLAYNQAAEEEGWIRIKPLTQPLEKTIYAETARGTMSSVAEKVIRTCAEKHGCQLVILSGGALANRAKDFSTGNEFEV
jgi:hypothetical protein